MIRLASTRLRLAFLCLVLPVALATTPATAQPMSAKDGWSLLRALLDGAGLAVSVNRIEAEGDGLLLHDLAIRPARDAREAVLRMPTLAVQPRGDDGVALIPSWNTVLTLPDGAAEVEFRFVGEIGLAADDNQLRLMPALGVIEATLTGGAGDAPDSLRIDLGFDDLRGLVELGLGPQIDLRATLTASSMLFGQRLSMSDGRGTPMERHDDTIVGGLALEFSLDRADLLAGDAPVPSLSDAFAGGFGMRLRLSAAESQSRSRQTVNGMEVRVEIEGGASESRFEMAEGALSLDGEAQDFRILTEVGPYLADIVIAHMRSGFSLPMAPAEVPGRFGLVLELEGMQASEESWAAIGAAGFAAESADLVIDLAGEGRWLADILSSDEPPLDLSAITLDRLTLRFGETRLEGSGRFDIDPGATPIAPDGPPPGEGTFRFALSGGERLLQRLGAEGVLPADQQFMARMMLLGVGRRAGDDLLESEITIGPEGRVLVNGLPLPF